MIDFDELQTKIQTEWLIADCWHPELLPKIKMIKRASVAKQWKQILMDILGSVCCKMNLLTNAYICRK